MDFSIFATPEAWISLFTLIFLEIILGIDNIVFIAITTDRLPVNQQSLGRKLGLLGAMVMRILFLCFAAWLVSMTTPLFTIDWLVINGEPFGMSARDLVLFIGGAYLVYKGIDELRSVLSLSVEKAKASGKEEVHKRLINLPEAIGIIMVMDLVFSIDSVITAVGLADHLIIMILAVLVAIVMMMVFIDIVSDFINKHVEIKILALFFILAIGILLVFEGLGLTSHIMVLGMELEKLMVYFAMVFATIIEVLQMRYDKKYHEWIEERHSRDLAAAMSQAESKGEYAGAPAHSIDQASDAVAEGSDSANNGQEVSSKEE